MRRRSLGAEVVAGAFVGAVVILAAVVVYVALSEGAASVRSGLHVRALQMGAAALLAAVIAVVSLAAYSRWRNVTERPHTGRRRHVPSRVEVALVGALVAGLVVASWPVLVHAYRNAQAAFTAFDVAWAVGYAVAGAAFGWFVVWTVVRFVRWERFWERCWEHGRRARDLWRAGGRSG
jgi:hypothetical protein